MIILMMLMMKTLMSIGVMVFKTLIIIIISNTHVTIIILINIFTATIAIIITSKPDVSPPNPVLTNSLKLHACLYPNVFACVFDVVAS